MKMIMLWDIVQICICFIGVIIMASLVEYTCDLDDDK